MKIVLVSLALLVTACGGATATPRPAATAGDRGVGVTAAEFGDDWPFAVPSGRLACYPSGQGDGRMYVTFTSGGVEYGINGSAREFGDFAEPDATIVTDWPNGSRLGPIIERGLELCG